MAGMAQRDETVAAVRRFNRDYTRNIGLLEETLTGSGFTLAEARVIFELGSAGGGVARDIARDLRLDPAYLTRILQRLTKEGLVSAQPNGDDRRQRDLELTAAGLQALARLQGAADEQIGALLAHLAPGDRRRLASALGEVGRLLDPAAPARELVIRAHRPGDIGWVISRQSKLYAEEYGWDGSYEALAAEICAAFIRDFREGREYCWIAELGGEPVGAVFLVWQSDEVAKLRLLHVEASARGHGIGAKLVAACIEKARAAGYARLVLWTNDVLGSARKIYQAAGFRLVEEERHHSFGKDLVGQNWELEL